MLLLDTVDVFQKPSLFMCLWPMMVSCRDAIASKKYFFFNIHKKYKINKIAEWESTFFWYVDHMAGAAWLVSHSDLPQLEAGNGIKPADVGEGEWGMVTKWATLWTSWIRTFENLIKQDRLSSWVLQKLWMPYDMIFSKIKKKNWKLIYSIL